MRFAFIFALLPLPAFADAPVVEDAWAEGRSVHVSLSHPDSAWAHYADGWEVLDAAGNRLGLRVLAHPHEAEQPFTRSLTLDRMPEGPLFIRARCLVDGWNAGLSPVRRE